MEIPYVSRITEPHWSVSRAKNAAWSLRARDAAKSLASSWDASCGVPHLGASV